MEETSVLSLNNRSLNLSMDSFEFFLFLLNILLICRHYTFYLMRSVLPNSHLFQKKVKIVSLQKGISNFAYTHSGITVMVDLETAMDR